MYCTEFLSNQQTLKYIDIGIQQVRFPNPLYEKTFKYSTNSINQRNTSPVSLFLDAKVL